MLENILRNGRKFGDWFKHGVYLPNVGWIEVYHDTGKVYLCENMTHAIELHGIQSAIVRGIMAMQQS